MRKSVWLSGARGAFKRRLRGCNDPDVRLQMEVGGEFSFGDWMRVQIWAMDFGPFGPRSVVISEPRARSWWKLRVLLLIYIYINTRINCLLVKSKKITKYEP